MTELEKQIKLEALKVEVEGMKAENEARSSWGEGPAYGSPHFFEKAAEMRALLDEPEADGDLLPDGMYYVSSGRLNFIGRTAVVDNTGVPIAEFYKEDPEAEKIVYYWPYVINTHGVKIWEDNLIFRDRNAAISSGKIAHVDHKEGMLIIQEFTLAD